MPGEQVGTDPLDMGWNSSFYREEWGRGEEAGWERTGQGAPRDGSHLHRAPVCFLSVGTSTMQLEPGPSGFTSRGHYLLLSLCPDGESKVPLCSGSETHYSFPSHAGQAVLCTGSSCVPSASGFSATLDGISVPSLSAPFMSEVKPGSPRE